MAFEILNEAASVVYVLAGENRYPQAEPDKVDFDILAQGINEEGVVSGCAVTERGAGQNATVDVTAGVVRIAGTDVAYAGGNVNCGAAHAALPRFDLIAINNAGVASAVNGVAAAPPVFPAVPANSVIVAAVWRAANDNTIANADIVDKRCLLLGGALGTAPTLIGIVGGIATPNRSHHTLSAQAGAADDLDGLAVSSIITNGEIVIIRPDAGDTITVKHNALGGADARNILCIGNADIVLDDDHDFAICIYASAIGAGSWMVLGGGAAGGGNTLDAAYDQGGAGAGRIITVDSGAVELRHTSNLTMLATRDPGDAVDRFALSRDGDMSWGSGAGAADIVLSRAAANRLAFVAGDILSVQYIADTAGTTRITTAAASPHVRVAGDLHVFGNTGERLRVGPLAPTANNIIEASTKIGTYGDFAEVNFFVASPVGAGIAIGTFPTVRGMFGQPLVNLAAGSVNGSIYGLQFTPFARLGGGGSTLAALYAIYATYGITSYSGTIADAVAGNFVAPIHIGAFHTVTLSTGVNIGNFGNSNRIVDAYGLKIADMTTNTGFQRLIEAGPATPYLRLVGGGNPAANQTNLYLKEAANLRQVQWMDPGAGGANFAGGERVMILV